MMFLYLVKEVAPEARRRNAELSVAFVYPDKHGRFVLKQVLATFYMVGDYIYLLMQLETDNHIKLLAYLFVFGNSLISFLFN